MEGRQTGREGGREGGREDARVQASKGKQNRLLFPHGIVVQPSGG